MKQPGVENAARILCESRLEGHPIGPLPPQSRPRDMAQAYDVQDRLHALLRENGYGTPCGYKIGCTTRVMQDYLDIDQPCAGAMFDTRLASERTEIALADHRRLGVECEIAVRLGRDLAAGDAPHGRAQVTDAIDAWMPSLEIVEDRYQDYSSLGAPTLVADDFFHAACVTGPPIRRGAVPEIAMVEGRLAIDGVEAGRGNGSDILGDPVEALIWLANHLGARGKTLASGSVVTLGSVVKTVWIDGPATAEADFPTLGRATAVFF